MVLATMTEAYRYLARNIAERSVRENRPLTRGEEIEIANLLVAADELEEQEVEQQDPVTDAELRRAKSFVDDVRTKAVAPERDDDGGRPSEDSAPGSSAADVEYAAAMKAAYAAHKAGTYPPIPPEVVAEHDRVLGEIERVDEQLEGTLERRDRQRLHRKRDELTEELGATIRGNK